MSYWLSFPKERMSPSLNSISGWNRHSRPRAISKVDSCWSIASTNRGRACISGVVDHKPRDVAGASRKIEHPHLRSGLDPPSQEMSGERVASKMAIELAQISQITPQLRRNRLRPVHQFRFGGIKLPLH